MATAGAEVLIRPLALCGVATAALILSACGGSVATRSSRVADARARAVDAGTSRFEITYESSELPADVEVELAGEIDYVHGVGRLRFGYKDNVYEEIIFTGKRMYVRMPSLAKYLGTTKEWTSYENDDDDDALNVVSFVGGPTQIRDPSKVLEFLLGTSGEIRQVGTEEVRGVPTTHYRGAIDIEKVIDRAPAGERAALREELELLGEDGFPKTIPFDVWIDDDGLARRVRLELAPGKTGGAETIEFYDFGVAVDVQPPDPSEVLTDEEFAKLMEQHAGESEACDDTASDDTKTTTNSESGGVFRLCATAVAEGESEADK